MTLLMPDYERQLKDASRRLAAESEHSSSRRSLSSALLGGISMAVALAIAAVVLVVVHGSRSTRTAGQSLPAVQYDCARGQVVSDRGPLLAVARGTVAGTPWIVEADSARRGPVSVQAGRLVIGARSYGFCRTGLDLELINLGRHGVVYGLTTQPYRPPFQIEGVPGHGTAAHPIKAKSSPVNSRHVRGAFLFVSSLPKSACAYRSLAMTASQGPGQSTLGMSGIYSGTCRPGQLRQAKQQGSGSSTPRIGPPDGLSHQGRVEYDAGRAELGQDGCLACHQIGSQGNDGPGPNLTHIGQILHARALRSTLINPTAPMPSFKSLPDRRLRALVFFLQHLR